jgi:glycosyltransferase involved in cell wall biosynthesis
VLEVCLLRGVNPKQIVVVDNASIDGTPDYLQQLGLGSVILNCQNLSCGAAWNQGILARQSDWTIVINNDIIVAPNFAQKLINFAKLKKFC